MFNVYNLIDEFTRQHLALCVERRMGAADVIEMLDLAALTHGAPQVLNTDNGSEFIAAGMVNSWKTTCSIGSTTPALSSAPGRAATMKNTPTARWADSQPTSTRTDGHNTTNNQQPSKHPILKTRPDQDGTTDKNICDKATMTEFGTWLADNTILVWRYATVDT